MSCLFGVSRPVAARAYFFLLAVLSISSGADAFATDHQQRIWMARLFCATASGGSPPHTPKWTKHDSSAIFKARRSTAQIPPMKLRAEGDAGGENSGQIFLAERSVNRVTLIGRVGLDPEIRHLPSGDRMASFSLATSEQWRDKVTGEVRSRTEWHRVVVFDKGLVNLVEAFVHKGRRLYVDGSLQTRRWVASDGQERYTTEVVLSKYKGELVLLEGTEDKRLGASASRGSSLETATNSDMVRAVSATQAVKSEGLSAGTFGTQQQLDAIAARNAVGNRGAATPPVPPNASWH